MRSLSRSSSVGFDARWAVYQCQRQGHKWRPNGWDRSSQHMRCIRCGKAKREGNTDG